MKLYVLASDDPAFNLALEELLLTQTQGDAVMLWRNRSTVVCGCNQNILAEVDLPYLQQNGIDLVRRISGGGAVYHDPGNVNFSFFTDYKNGEFGDFSRFCAPIAAYLKTLGLNACMSGRNDLLLGSEKFSGNAQAVRKDRLLHHGTLLFDTDLSVLSKALLPDLEKLTTKGISSVRSRVTNLRPHLLNDMTADTFFNGLAAFFQAQPDCTLCTPTQPMLEAAKTAAEQKYRSSEWLYGKSPAYTFRNRKRFEGGSIELQLTVKNAVITDAAVYGDYFFTRPSEEFCALLRGVFHTPQAVENLLNGIDCQEFFSGMKNTQILSLFF